MRTFREHDTLDLFGTCTPQFFNSQCPDTVYLALGIEKFYLALGQDKNNPNLGQKKFSTTMTRKPVFLAHTTGQMSFPTLQENRC